MKRNTWLWVLIAVGGSAALAEEPGYGAGGGAAIPVNAAYEKECSACHMAFPAEMLPVASWDRIMATLDNHFGENAQLDSALQAEIAGYLRAAAPDVAVPDPANPPLRITELPWFTGEHGARLAGKAKSDPKIGTLSNCGGCHTGTGQGMLEGD